uniref:Uncharacterized protein n=1 Tax=Moumouvirus sp. 'Monve' TaxID=1128131 RepID=H2EFA7_9VIRU|nr:hypothetical protein mv_R970 [Moumouvirus Monve]
MCSFLSYNQNNNVILKYRYNLFKRARMVNNKIRKRNSMYPNTVYQYYNMCGYII